MNSVDWQAFLIVIVLVGGLSYVAYLDAMRAARKPAVDHEQCIADGCDQVLCYCRTDTVCKGTVKPGCEHVELVCDDHRHEHCGGCRADARFDAGHAS